MTRSDVPGFDRRRLIQGAGLALGAAALGLDPARAQGPGTPGTRNTDTVRLGWGRGGLPLIARERGEFEKGLADQGITVKWVGPFPNHAPSLQALVGGSADFGFWGSTTPALAAIIAGSPLVFTNYNVYAPRSTAIIVKKKSGIDSVKDLAGKKVAVNRSGLGEFLLVAALEKHGVDRKSVEFVYLNPPDASPAFGQGRVDAWSMWTPAVDIARDLYDAKNIFFEGTDLDFLIDYSSLVSLRDFTTKNSALVRAVIDAYAREGRWISDNPVEAETIAQKEGKYGDAVRDHLAGLKRQNRFYEADDAVFLAGFQKAADWLADRAILPKRVKVADHSVRV
ncbi:sulfonate ABC transporter substrate-binding protein [Methylobacterium indicum]|uniref:NrtA/SsuA/CpmA family ABC transporter substrate-binding protein n=1 Tax=Methylobacterium indicum TaxID=1775910 RepID=UPI00073451B9|nr:NrtA/SsuA/CpmA family ABC transporter substrate-binding protein [Methylobacterium indicum]KTS37847.1 sulfonate ABC transporter substrate-binding protein [Methylobacterium indicum]KTS41012.1 sulfonate ABC transporter substrate-binding protein [Methylobacterium indicum]KTS50695.1 sulfonate ABC transporter substrate-binding protein [Methylobacterium indicum]